MIDNVLLFPYYLTLKIRHFLYDRGIRKSTGADVPAVCIGNITVGGTGKTPHTEMVVRTLLSLPGFEGKHIAVLSRGYKRKSKGFQQVMTDSTADFAGDEPLQIKCKFPSVTVAVDVKRVEGCDFLCHPEKLAASKKGRKCLDRDFPAADIIVLDDAFQHRALKPDLSVLLIDFHRPVADDHLMPLGRLRDLKERTSAADVIIITKCPSFMDENEKDQWLDSLGIRDFDYRTRQGRNSRSGKTQTVLFSTIRYGDAMPVFEDADPRYVYAKRAVLFSGIANDMPLRSYLAGRYSIAGHLQFGDHHRFTTGDLRSIGAEAGKEPTAMLATTEKDSQRLKGMKKVPEALKKRMFQIPIEAVFLTEEEKSVFQDIIANLQNCR